MAKTALESLIATITSDPYRREALSPARREKLRAELAGERPRSSSGCWSSGSYSPGSTRITPTWRVTRGWTPGRGAWHKAIITIGGGVGAKRRFLQAVKALELVRRKALAESESGPQTARVSQMQSPQPACGRFQQLKYCN